MTFRAMKQRSGHSWTTFMWPGIGRPLGCRSAVTSVTIDVTVVREGLDEVYLVRPYAPMVGWLGDGTDPDVWHLSRVPKETPTEALCGELLGDPQVMIPMHELSHHAKRCERCVEVADDELMERSRPPEHVASVADRQNSSEIEGT